MLNHVNARMDEQEAIGELETVLNFEFLNPRKTYTIIYFLLFREKTKIFTVKYIVVTLELEIITWLCKQVVTSLFFLIQFTLLKIHEKLFILSS